MKMRWIYSVAVLMFTWEMALAQCTGERYTYQLFVDHSVTSDVRYGQNLAFDSAQEELYLDVYEPLGDRDRLRPLVILAHGGSLVFGGKSNTEMVQLGRDLARMGYVVASMEYRKGIEGLEEGYLDSVVVLEANIRAVQDMRAAIRYFKRDVAENGNTFGIDTARMVIGGLSAGAIVALHTAFMDELEEIPAWVDLGKPGLGGGIEGQSGNPGYTSKGVRAIINISGALMDTSWIKHGDMPVFSLHGDLDDIVPYGSDTVWLLGLVPLVVVDGSASVHERAIHEGILNCLYTFKGAQHVSDWDTMRYTDTVMSVLRNALRHVTCEAPVVCGYTGATAMPRPAVEVQIYPNPSEGRVYVRSACDVSTLDVYDTHGCLIHASRSPGTPIQHYRSELVVSGLADGLYLLKVRTLCGSSVHRLVVRSN